MGIRAKNFGNAVRILQKRALEEQACEQVHQFLDDTDVSAIMRVARLSLFDFSVMPHMGRFSLGLSAARYQ